MERNNNFDFLRLVFSILVIFSHSYLLTNNEEIAESITNKQLNLGALSVNLFFVLSGYLVCISLRNSHSAASFLWRRSLRLFPALFVMLLITLPILIIVYKGPNIFSQRDFYTYLPKSLTLYYLPYHVSGVFESNPFPRVINGSLWTLYYEFVMYIILLLLYPLRNKKALLTVLICIWIICFLLTILTPTFLNAPLWSLRLHPINFYRLSTFFIGGAILSFINLKELNKVYIKAPLLLILITSILFNCYKTTSYIVLPLLILPIGISWSKYLGYIPRKTGDLSYGIYIYGCLIQQFLMNYFNLSPLGLTCLSLPIIYVLAFFSWKWIEKPALGYKNLLEGHNTPTEIDLPMPYTRLKQGTKVYEKFVSLGEND